MTKNKAVSLAAALGGQVVQTMSQSRMQGIALTRPDGRYALIGEDAGAVYLDEHACRMAHQTLGDDPRISIETQEWGKWGLTESWATGLATLIGGEAHHCGGNVWVVLFRRSDGQFVVIGEDVAELYESEDHYERYYEPGQEEPVYLYWS